MKFKIPTEVADFLRDNATIIHTHSKYYYYLPYWYELPESGDVVEQYYPDNIPNDLKNELRFGDDKNAYNHSNYLNDTKET